VRGRSQKVEDRRRYQHTHEAKDGKLWKAFPVANAALKGKGFVHKKAKVKRNQAGKNVGQTVRIGNLFACDAQTFSIEKFDKYFPQSKVQCGVAHSN
jgi:hypothetical protein